MTRSQQQTPNPNAGTMARLACSTPRPSIRKKAFSKKVKIASSKEITFLSP